MRPLRLPPVIERKPSEANARAVIRAAERGERLWLEGNEGIAQPMEQPGPSAFVRAWQRMEDEMHESIAQSAQIAGATSVERVGNAIAIGFGRTPKVKVQ
jgi:hypothetical protein